MHYYSFILYQCVIPSIHILQLEDDDSQIQNTGNHFTEEIIAQAACEAHATRRDQFGRVYAVGKKCSRSYTCANICASSSLHAQDSQTVNHKWSCIAAFHVYYGRPSTTKNGEPNTAKLGLKSKLESCTY